MNKTTKTCLGMLFGVAASALPEVASAQSVTVDQFHPAETAEDGFALSRPDDRGHVRFGAQLYLDYALNPLVYEPVRGSSANEVAIIEHQLAAHVGLSLGLFDRLVLFAGLPVNIIQDGVDAPPGGIQAADGAGLGDVNIGARVRLFGERDEVFALALQAYATLPSGQWANEAQRYTGERGATIVPELLAELRFGGGWRLTGNFGARFRITDESRFALGSLPISHEFLWGLGLTVPFIDQESNGVGLTGHIEAYGATTFENFGQRETSPVELIAGLRLEPVCGLQIGLGAGPGLQRGYGSPDVRGLFTIGFSDSHCTAAPVEEAPPPPADDDRDNDGILNDVDQCADEPEDVDTFEDENGCPDPDNDGDGVLDVNDGAPMEPEDADQFEDADGVPDPDNDNDGVLDVSDRCPMEAEDTDRVQDEDGCPETDADQDTILDPDDHCPLTPGVPNTENPQCAGCPALACISETGSIQILDQVYFATNSDVILDRSFPVLTAVHEVLSTSPQMRRVRIEGHTDDRGRDDRNLDLSRRRAASVRRWLIEHGIDAGRLEAWGCGELHPIETNRTSTGRQQNRRVEFHITDPAPESGARQLEGCIEATE